MKRPWADIAFELLPVIARRSVLRPGIELAIIEVCPPLDGPGVRIDRALGTIRRLFESYTVPPEELER